jgi:hypothetical protein
VAAAHRSADAECKIHTTAKKAKLLTDLRKPKKVIEVSAARAARPRGATSKFVSEYTRSACSFFNPIRNEVFVFVEG